MVSKSEKISRRLRRKKRRREREILRRKTVEEQKRELRFAKLRKAQQIAQQRKEQVLSSPKPVNLSFQEPDISKLRGKERVIALRGRKLRQQFASFQRRASKIRKIAGSGTIVTPELVAFQLREPAKFKTLVKLNRLEQEKVRQGLVTPSEAGRRVRERTQKAIVELKKKQAKRETILRSQKKVRKKQGRVKTVVEFGAGKPVLRSAGTPSIIEKTAESIKRTVLKPTSVQFVLSRAKRTRRKKESELKRLFEKELALKRELAEISSPTKVQSVNGSLFLKDQKRDLEKENRLKRKINKLKASIFATQAAIRGGPVALGALATTPVVVASASVAPTLTAVGGTVLLASQVPKVAKQFSEDISRFGIEGAVGGLAGEAVGLSVGSKIGFSAIEKLNVALPKWKIGKSKRVKVSNLRSRLKNLFEDLSFETKKNTVSRNKALVGARNAELLVEKLKKAKPGSKQQKQALNLLRKTTKFLGVKLRIKELVGVKAEKRFFQVQDKSSIRNLLGKLATKNKVLSGDANTIFNSVKITPEFRSRLVDPRKIKVADFVKVKGDEKLIAAAIFDNEKSLPIVRRDTSKSFEKVFRSKDFVKKVFQKANIGLTEKDLLNVKTKRTLVSLLKATVKPFDKTNFESFSAFKNAKSSSSRLKFIENKLKLTSKNLVGSKFNPDSLDLVATKKDIRVKFRGKTIGKIKRFETRRILGTNEVGVVDRLKPIFKKKRIIQAFKSKGLFKRNPELVEFVADFIDNNLGTKDVKDLTPKLKKPKLRRFDNPKNVVKIGKKTFAKRGNKIFELNKEVDIDLGVGLKQTQVLDVEVKNKKILNQVQKLISKQKPVSKSVEIKKVSKKLNEVFGKRKKEVEEGIFIIEEVIFQPKSKNIKVGLAPGPSASRELKPVKLNFSLRGQSNIFRTALVFSLKKLQKQGRSLARKSKVSQKQSLRQKQRIEEKLDFIKKLRFEVVRSTRRILNQISLIDQIIDRDLSRSPKEIIKEKVPLKPPKVPSIKKLEEKEANRQKQIKKLKKLKFVTGFRSDLTSVLFKIKASREQSFKLLTPGKLFSGFGGGERPLIPDDLFPKIKKVKLKIKKSVKRRKKIVLRSKRRRL